MNDQSSNCRRSIYSDLAILIGTWGLAVILINPIGDFPLNDDWAWGLVVKNWLEQGDFRPSDWGSMTLLTNALWGMLYCLPAGFSFTALRLSTLTMAIVGLVACYLLYREFKLPRWLIMLTGFTLAFNPIYFALANTFMTDVLYTTVEVLAAWFFIKNLKSNNHAYLVWGVVFTIALTLSRQIGVIIPFGFAVLLLLSRGFTRQNLLRAGLPFLICLMALLIFQKWMDISGRTPAQYHLKSDSILFTLKHPKQLFKNLTTNGYIVLLNLGLFMLPLTLCSPVIASLARQKTRLLLVLASVLLMVGLAGLKYLLAPDLPFLMPLGNILANSGIGPVEIRDVAILHLNHLLELPSWFWIMINILSFIGAALLITCLVVFVGENLRKIKQRLPFNVTEEGVLFLFILAMLYIAPLLLITGMLFDRYFIPLIPFLAVVILYKVEWQSYLELFKKPVLPVCSVLLVVLFSGYAIGATHDYLSWNRVRWAALAELENQQIPKTEIDGGFEFNGINFYDINYKPPANLSSWWVKDDKYIVSFGSIAGYSEFKKIAVEYWLPPHLGNLYVLNRD